MKKILPFIFALALALACSPAEETDEPADAPAAAVTDPASGDNLPEAAPDFAGVVFSYADDRPADARADLSSSLKFAELILELSGGGWMLEIQNGGALGGDGAVLALLSAGELDFTLISEDAFDSAAPETPLVELCRFDGGVIAAGAALWNGFTPEEQSIILQCALEVAFAYGPPAIYDP